MSTLSQKISQRLARDIVDGVLKPGAKLEEIVLAKRFRVSRSPVRDALRELAATGLIESQPRRGFLCAKLCALRAGMAEKKQIELVHNRARKAVLDGDADSYAELNESFHQSIYIGARNRNLQALAANLRQRLEAFRLQEFFNTGDRLQTSVAEHEVITRAIIRADAVGAFDAMCAHTASSATNVIEFFEQQHGGGRAGNTVAPAGGRLLPRLTRPAPVTTAAKKPRSAARGTRR
ncbi:MAG: GntR family transcriptional regulator [Proteobacteria bacterium]|nr:GntR family transcriptional regulator [Pseudomonadota bacterium]